MGTSHSSASWKLDGRSKIRERGRAESDVYRKMKSVKARPVKNHKSESNLWEEMQNRTVHINPLYRHTEMFDNGLFFEEILAKIEEEAAKLSSPERHGSTPKGFDSFMMY